MLKLKGIEGQTYLILGFGKSGKAAAAFLQANDARVLVWDDSEATRLVAGQAGYTLADPMTLDFGPLAGLITAPGIFPTHPAIVKARKEGLAVMNDLPFLFHACPEATYVGITGTNGKSTTTALIAHILSSAGKKVQMGGNIGQPVLSLEPLEKGGIFVLELSSYQLDLLDKHPFGVGLLLNITPDHIDHHGSMKAYIAAKENLIQKTKKQTFILGTDEPETQSLWRKTLKLPNVTALDIAITHAAKKGITIKDHRLHFVQEEQKNFDLASCKALVGAHNAQNAAAAYLACKALGLSAAEIEKGLQSFAGLAHRQQLIATLRGVRFINDSKATNADATSKALATYNAIYWIAGGVPKEGGLSGLEAFMPRVRQAFLIGEAEEAFAAWCEGKVSFTRCGSLDKAVAKAAQMAWEDGQKEACVLLSPACASFDQFQSFEHRGDVFISLVQALTAQE